jgi:hypothetical protein
MAEAVTSHALSCAAQDVDRRREQMEEFELLIEKLIEQSGRRESELRQVTAERDRLKEENERLRGE